jgi:hypothetical protein
MSHDYVGGHALGENVTTASRGRCDDGTECRRMGASGGNAPTRCLEVDVRLGFEVGRHCPNGGSAFDPVQGDDVPALLLNGRLHEGPLVDDPLLEVEVVDNFGSAADPYLNAGFGVVETKLDIGILQYLLVNILEGPGLDDDAVFIGIEDADTTNVRLVPFDGGHETGGIGFDEFQNLGLCHTVLLLKLRNLYPAGLRDYE